MPADIIDALLRGLLMAGFVIFVSWVWNAFTGKPVIFRRNIQGVPLRALVTISCVFAIFSIIGFLIHQYDMVSFFAVCALINIGRSVRHALRRKRGAEE